MIIKSLGQAQLRNINGGSGVLKGILLGIAVDMGKAHLRDVVRNPEKYRPRRGRHYSYNTGMSL